MSTREELRTAVLKVLSAQGGLAFNQLVEATGYKRDPLGKVVRALVREGLIVREGRGGKGAQYRYSLPAQE